MKFFIALAFLAFANASNLRIVESPEAVALPAEIKPVEPEVVIDQVKVSPLRVVESFEQVAEEQVYKVKVVDVFEAVPELEAPAAENTLIIVHEPEVRDVESIIEELIEAPKAIELPAASLPNIAMEVPDVKPVNIKEPTMFLNRPNMQPYMR